jgi:hypothetical protein
MTHPSEETPMTDVRDILARALPDAPSVPITRETAVAAGRLAARRRRSLVAAGAAGAATMLVIAGAALLPGGLARSTSAAASAEPSGPATAGPSADPTATSAPSAAPTTPEPTATSEPTPVRPPVMRRLTEPRAAATARLTADLKAAVRPVLPASVLRPVTVLWTSGTRTHRPLEVFRIEGVYMGLAKVSDSQGIGSVDFHLNPYLGENPKRSFAGYCAVVLPPTESCETRIGPGGELITIEVGHPSTDSPVVEYRVDLVKADGTALVCVARNVGDATDPNVGPVQRPDPPLTVDQMVEILLAPGLTLYP